MISIARDVGRLLGELGSPTRETVEEDAVLIQCQSIKEKLRILYRAYERAADLLPRITGSGALIAELKIGKGTLAAWSNGRSDKGRAPDRIDEGDLTRLAELIVAVTGARIALTDARHLWERASIGEFRRRLLGTEELNLLAVIINRPAKLAITIKKHQPPTRNLEWIVVDKTPLDGEFALKIGDSFTIDVVTQKGRALVVIGRSSDGWYLFLPDDTFDGMARQAHQRLPTTSAWEPSSVGRHTLFVLEFSRGPAPLRRKRGELRLDPAAERLLIEELSDESLSGQWRWGSVDLHVSPA